MDLREDLQESGTTSMVSERLLDRNKHDLAIKRMIYDQGAMI